MDHIPVIVNASAGTASKQIPQLCQMLVAHGVQATVTPVEPRDLRAAVTDAARANPIVAVAGGDGTLSTAAAAILETEASLAPIPLGTRNHFARRLGIDGLEAAMRALATGRTTRVALGSVGGRTFINHASAGIYPRLLRVRARVRPWTGKAVGNFVSGAVVVLRPRRTRLRIDVEGAKQTRSVSGIWVGVGRGSFRLPVDNAPGEGALLEVLLAPHAGRTATFARGLRVLRQLYNERDLESAGLDVLHVRELTLDAAHMIDLSLDGEVEEVHRTLDFKVLPNALRVVSPIDG